MAHILLVEDTYTLGMTLELNLTGQGHTVSWCQNLAQARETFRDRQPDLVLLDLGLPDGDGLDFCREMRLSGSITPVIVITARETLQARVDGLSKGADDYVTKPFELPELLARVEAMIRRQLWHGPGERASIGRLELDMRRRLAWHDGQPVSMTELKFNLLQYFRGQPNQAVSREELLVKVWGQNPSTQTRTVDVFVSRLRRLIEVDPSKPEYLLNVRGIGYRLRLPEEDPSPES